MTPTSPSDQALGRLLQATDDQLFEQLGIRAKAIAANPAAAGSFEPNVAYDGAAMGPLDDVREYGKRLYKRWNREAYKLICGSDKEEITDRQKLLDAFGGGEVAVAAALSGLFVAHLGLAPALAGILAAITLKYFFRPAYDEFCSLWHEKLPS